MPAVVRGGPVTTTASGGGTSARNVSEQEAPQGGRAARETEWRKPSFGKELFLGRFRLDLIHPHPKPDQSDTERGEAFLEKLERFLREEVDPAVIERDAQIPDTVIKGLKEIGAFGMKIPEEYGGRGVLQEHYHNT